jgi:hypothetical protein
MLDRGLFGVARCTGEVARSLPVTLPHLEEVRVLGAVPGVRAGTSSLAGGSGTPRIPAGQWELTCLAGSAVGEVAGSEPELGYLKRADVFA